MKFSYSDESGLGQEPILVVSAIFADQTRVHRTMDDWDGLLAEMSQITGKQIEELKTGELYRGNDFWRGVDGADRTALIEKILGWLTERKHQVTFGAVLKGDFDKKREQAPAGLDGISAWSLAALHVILGAQKRWQREKNNKGKTVFIFDEAAQRQELLGLILDPPTVTDAFYKRAKKNRPIDQMIDVPFFIDSRHAALLSLADLLAYLLRLHAELQLGVTQEQFEGERGRLEGWVERIRPLLLADSDRWSKTATDPLTKFLLEVAPAPLLKLD